MKKRIKIDSSLLSVAILFTGVLYQFPSLYPSSRILDNGLDWIGLLVLLKGTYIRMAARGVKKAHSRQGTGLVKTGLYSIVRNPMYLGSFMMGTGFVLIVWPCWILPVFAGLFYLRFRKQIIKEEQWLAKNFGKDYILYCQHVPRLFPRGDKLWSLNASMLFPWKETWSTKETRGLLFWPLLAVILESVQEWRVFGLINMMDTILIFLSAAVVFSVGLAIHYQRD